MICSLDSAKEIIKQAKKLTLNNMEKLNYLEFKDEFKSSYQQKYIDSIVRTVNQLIDHSNKQDEAIRFLAEAIDITVGSLGKRKNWNRTKEEINKLLN